jgi:hypothetical protein
MCTEWFLNGINGNTGGYLLPPISAEVLSALAQEDSVDRRQLLEFQWRARTNINTPRLALEEGRNPKDLSQTGWGILFPQSMNPSVTKEIREALMPLLQKRQAAAAKRDKRLYREYSGSDGYRAGEGKFDFLERNGAGPGPVNPLKIPYYLLLVGSPEDIPFEFQYQLNLQHAVGRIYFKDSRDYAEYAQSVLKSESDEGAKRRVAGFIGPHNMDDPATELSSHELIIPLARKLQDEVPSWAFETYVAEKATKETFQRLLGGETCPTIFFSATHGIGFNSGNRKQCAEQGALICQEWPGPQLWQKALPDAFYFSGSDVASNACMIGSICFLFACYSAGTPETDDFGSDDPSYRRSVAPRPFVAQLPQRLLSQPNGGALAVIGHIDQTWGASFYGQTSGRQLGVFAGALRRLIEGHPLGSAMEPFSTRYSELAAGLSDELKEIRRGKRPNHRRLASLWTAQMDARGYVIIGDPAVTIVRAKSGAEKTLH